jgi:hypothetical protein
MTMTSPFDRAASKLAKRARYLERRRARRRVARCAAAADPTCTDCHGTGLVDDGRVICGCVEIVDVEG